MCGLCGSKIALQPKPGHTIKGRIELWNEKGLIKRLAVVTGSSGTDLVARYGQIVRAQGYNIYRRGTPYGHYENEAGTRAILVTGDQHHGQKVSLSTHHRKR